MNIEVEVQFHGFPLSSVIVVILKGVSQWTKLSHAGLHIIAHLLNPPLTGVNQHYRVGISQCKGVHLINLLTVSPQYNYLY
jgi:hypothetical protein